MMLNSNHGNSALGCLAMLVTPFHDDGSLDADALLAHCRWLRDSGVHTVVPTGGLGEGKALSVQESSKIWAIASEVFGATKGKVIGGIPHCGSDLKSMLGLAEELRMDALLAFVPEAPGKDLDTEGWLADLLERSPIPIIFDWRPNSTLSLESVDRLIRHTNVMGIKYGSADLRGWVALRGRVADRVALIAGAGDDVAVGFCAEGAQGYTSSLVNVLPRYVMGIAREVLRGEYQGSSELHAQFLKLAELRGREPGYDIAVVKYAASLVGPVGSTCRAPIPKLDSDTSACVRKLLP